MAADATSAADAETLCARAVERFGRIDTFVASVMVTVYAEVEQLDEEELRRVMDVNFLGRVHAYRAALPHLKASHGTFIDVTRASPTGDPAPGRLLRVEGRCPDLFESARVELAGNGPGSTSA